MSVKAFLEAVAARTPTPGGGSAAAAAGALGAALGLMSLRFSKDAESYETRLEEIRLRLTALVDEDARAYQELSQAFKLPKGTEAERKARLESIRRNSLQAALPPLEGMRRTLEALSILKASSGVCNRNLLSDLISASTLLHAAGVMFFQNVAVNLKNTAQDATLGAEARRLCSELNALKVEIDLLIGTS